MSKIRPVIGDPKADAYHAEVSPDTPLVENFLWKLLLVTALAYLVWSEKVSIDFGLFSFRKTEIEQQISKGSTDFWSFFSTRERPRYGVLLEDETINNLTFAIDPGYAERNDISEEVVEERTQQCRLFIKRFKPVAIAEMRQYGIPASILLAQALIASDAGTNALAAETNNFFQRPCNRAKCRAGHYTDLSDPEYAALIDVFPNLWGSFRAQSLYLKNSAAFAELFQSGDEDFRIWARGLQAGSYCEDEQYAEKLMAVVTSLHLDEIDARR